MKFFKVKAFTLMLLLAFTFTACEQSEVLTDDVLIDNELVDKSIPCYPPSLADINMTQTASTVTVTVPTPHGQKTHAYYYRAIGGVWIYSGVTNNSFTFSKTECAESHQVYVIRKCSSQSWSDWSSLKTLTNNGPLCE